MVWEIHTPACEALSGVGQQWDGKRMGWIVGWGPETGSPLATKFWVELLNCYEGVEVGGKSIFYELFITLNYNF